MREKQIDMNLLRVFEVIYAEQNLTRAAEILHLSQPAVSNALARLRHTLDDPLFVRSPSGMTPTPAARAMIGRVRRALQLLDSCMDPATTFLPKQSDQTVICSFSDLAEVLLLPALIRRLGHEAPNMSVRSYHVPRAELPTELAAGTIDVAADVTFVNDRNLNHAPLINDEFVCAVRPRHPTVKNTLSLQQYLDLGHVHISSRRRGGGDIEQALKASGHRRRIVTRVRGYATAPQIVAATDLACSLPRSVAEQANLQIFELPFAVPKVNIHMYWHKSTDKDPANVWLRTLLQDIS